MADVTTLIPDPAFLLLGGLAAVGLVIVLVAILALRRRRSRASASPFTLLDAPLHPRHTLLPLRPAAQPTEPDAAPSADATNATADTRLSAAESLRRTAIPYTELSRKQRKAIERQAEADYAQARGTAHRTLLEAARKQVEAQLRQEGAEFLRLRRELEALEKQHQAELRTALELHLVCDRFDEVPGIGRALKARILAATQARSLADLRDAESVPGVGDGRMAAINAWTDDLRRQLPTLVTQPFPGRGPIDQRFAAQRSRLQQALAQSQNRSEPLRQRLAALDQHIAALEAVTPQTFHAAAGGDLEAQRAALHYTNGLFAEWEPVPGWFQTLIDGEST